MSIIWGLKTWKILNKRLLVKMAKKSYLLSSRLCEQMYHQGEIKSNHGFQKKKKKLKIFNLSSVCHFSQFQLPHLQDLLAVLNALFLPGVKYSLHRCMAHPIIQAREDPKANGTCHCRWGCGTSSTLIKRLEGGRDLSKPGLIPGISTRYWSVLTTVGRRHVPLIYRARKKVVQPL